MTRFLLVRAVMVRIVFAVGMCGLISCQQPASTNGASSSPSSMSGRIGMRVTNLPTRDLSRDEAAGGHILRKHVGRSDEQLRERLAFLGEHVECRLADAGASEEQEAYDLVLADVPCSGTGTLGRNPEIRHRLRMEDLARQAERQRAILSAAIRAVRPGGLVVYSTCSLEPEENEEVVAAVLAAMPRVRSISLDVRIGELMADGVVTVGGAERLRGSLTAEGALRLLPGAFHSDGFYIALIERIA